jgi:hypothetical protein
MAGCGGTEDEPAADETAAEETAAVPEVVSMLVTADDLDGEWTVNLYPDAPVQLSESGVVTEEMLEVIPRIELCESASAEAQAAVEGLRWQAFRQLDLTVDDPVDTTADAVSGRIIGVNEALLAGDPAEVEATFEALTSGLESCGWSTTADEDGHTSTAEPWEAVPEVGDDRVGVLTTIEEPGGGGGFVIYEVLVRDGSVLMKEMVAEAFIGEGVTPQLTADQAAAIVTTTAARIG